MKKLILTNWAAKIATLVLAMTLWFLIKKNVEKATPLLPNQIPVIQQIPEEPVADDPSKTVPKKSTHAKPSH
jgi:YbbR domain-containing protein